MSGVCSGRAGDSVGVQSRLVVNVDHCRLLPALQVRVTSSSRHHGNGVRAKELQTMQAIIPLRTKIANVTLFLDIKN